MEAWFQVLFQHLIEVTALVLMICMGTCLLIVRIYLQWKRTKRCYPPALALSLIHI